MKLLLLPLILMPFFYLAQDTVPLTPPPPSPIEATSEPVLDFPEVMPEFPGGEQAMYKWLVEHIEYPKVDFENGIQGKVYVQFVVDTKGQITDVTVLKGVSQTIDWEAVRVIKSMPLWKPGELNGKKVKVRFTIPINFTLK